ncbi:MAG: carboxyl-terminal protease, partial [Acidobacteria bacterium]|nr:carboxyl-terminal protease [Acidobacteriota bacterium]
ATLAAGKVKEAAAAIESLQKQGARRLILDLRNTAVGAADQGVALANLFVSSGTLAYLQGQRVPRQNFDAEAGRAMSSLPLAVLVNRGTADGAEIAAAALLEHKRAEVVGERTYGDAALRRPVTLEDGSAVILSVAKYYSPNGKAIQDTGVTPGTLVAEVEAQVELDENGEAVPQSEPEPQTLDDPILKKAIEGIRNR